MRARRFAKWILLGGFILLVGLALAYKGRRRLRGYVEKARAVASSEPEEPASGPWVGTRARTPIKIVEPIYDGGLKEHWQDYGWAERVTTGPGPARLKLNDKSGWIIARSGWEGGRFGALVFRVKAPRDFGEFLEVVLMSDVTDTLPVVKVHMSHGADLEDGWAEILVPMEELNPHGLVFDRVRIKARRAVGKDWVQLDGIGLTEPPPTAPKAPDYPSRGVALKVRCGGPGVAISPYIYGLATVEAAPELNAPVYRFGGNRATRHNWELEATNTGNDWYFHNVKEQSWRAFIAETAKRKAVAAITVPIMGWVSKDTTSCSFPVALFGRQKVHDPDRGVAGNGERPDMTKLPPGPPDLTSIPITPEWVARWVSTIRAEDAKRGTRVVREYMLDNEPMLWHQTHRDVHPEAPGYDELVDRTIRFGAAVRAADPDAIISGPAEWGWDGYFWSAKDGLAGTKNKPDRLAHGDVPLLAYYLQKLREHEQKTGVRILDVVDLHFYPEGQGVKGAGGSEPAVAALRLRETRTLWDPTYKDESWINEKIQLIPRIKGMIAESYPGRGFSIGEWNFGGEANLSGGLATAEALGRFAQGGLVSAYYWTAPKKGSPAYWAFRAYRNFDGAGARFEDTLLPAEAEEGASVFASRDGSGKHVVVIALNFDRDRAATPRLELSGCAPVASRQVFSYWGQPGGLIKTDGDLMRPWSITVFDLRLAD